MISEVMPINGRSQASFHETVEGLHIPYANSGGAASPKRLYNMWWHIKEFVQNITLQN